MKWKRFLVVLVCLGISAWAQANPPSGKAAGKPGAGAKGTASKIEALSRKAWEAFKAKDKDAYSKLLTDDFTGLEIDGKGPRNKTAGVAEAESYQINNYEISGFKTTSLGPNAALATYTVNANAVIDGKPVQEKFDVGEVWVKRDGDWKQLYYQESKRE